MYYYFDLRYLVLALLDEEPGAYPNLSLLGSRDVCSECRKMLWM